MYFRKRKATATLNDNNSKTENTMGLRDKKINKENAMNNKTIYNIKTHLLLMKRPERIAWVIVCFQFLIIISNRKSWSPIDGASSMNRMEGVRGVGSSVGRETGGGDGTFTTATDPKSLLMNDHTYQHYNERKKGGPNYDIAKIHPEKAGLVSRVWHSNGSPSINPNLQTGSCWCGADEWYVMLHVINPFMLHTTTIEDNVT